MFLLDTNILSELGKQQPDAKVIAWLDEHGEECFLSTISVSEMRYGIERLPDGKKRLERERKYKFLLEDFEGKFFDFDGPSASEWGRYAAELEEQFGRDWWKHFDLRDTQIAAIAREYGLAVATRNETHFPNCATENPFA